MTYTGLAYLDSTLTGATAIGAILLLAQDTTPGQEFFCWALKTHGGNDELHRDWCHALYKSPGTTGWNSIAVFPRTSKQVYGQVVLHGYSGSRFSGLPSGISSSIHTNGHLLRSGIVLGHYDFTLQAQGLFDSPPPLIQLPAPLFIGSTSIRGASTHFGKVTRPDGVMLQLGQRSSDRDVWPLVPSGTSHNQSSTWSSATSLSNWRECKAGHRHPGFHPPLSADELHGRPPAHSAGTSALRLRWLQRGRRGIRWRTDAACHRAALAAGDLSPAPRAHRPWIFSWVPILSPPPTPSSQNLIQLDFIAVIRAFLSGVPGRDVERKMRFKQAQHHRRQQSSTNEIPSL